MVQKSTSLESQAGFNYTTNGVLQALFYNFNVLVNIHTKLLTKAHILFNNMVKIYTNSI